MKITLCRKKLSAPSSITYVKAPLIDTSDVALTFTVKLPTASGSKALKGRSITSEEENRERAAGYRLRGTGIVAIRVAFSTIVLRCLS